MLRIGSGARPTSPIHRPIKDNPRARVTVVLLAGWLLAAAPAAGTSEELRRLAAGEVIVTDALPPGASKDARGGTAVVLLRASPEQVWGVIVDYRGHPRYYPHVTAADVVEMDERHVIVHYRIAIGPFSFGFFMEKY